MEKINEMVSKAIDECEKKGIPFLAAFGIEEISILEYAPESTPERIKKARTTLINTTMQARRQIQIKA